MLTEMIARVDSISRIYETLYKSADLETVDLKPYLEGLAGSLYRAYAHENLGCEFHQEIDSVRVDSKIAIPIGLILNECLTNALKYAFPPPRNGSVRVRLSAGKNRIVLTVSDDGVGMPPGFSPETSASLGLQLVTLLSKQLGATLSIQGAPGVTVTVMIKT